MFKKAYRLWRWQHGAGAHGLRPLRRHRQPHPNRRQRLRHRDRLLLLLLLPVWGKPCGAGARCLLLRCSLGTRWQLRLGLVRLRLRLGLRLWLRQRLRLRLRLRLQSWLGASQCWLLLWRRLPLWLLLCRRRSGGCRGGGRLPPLTAPQQAGRHVQGVVLRLARLPRRSAGASNPSYSGGNACTA